MDTRYLCLWILTLISSLCVTNVSAVICNTLTGTMICSNFCCSNSNLYSTSLLVCCSTSANSALNTANNIVGTVTTGISTVIIVVIVVSVVIFLGIVLCIACCVYQAMKKPTRTVGAVVVQNPHVGGPPAHTAVHVPPPHAGGPH